MDNEILQATSDLLHGLLNIDSEVVSNSAAYIVKLTSWHTMPSSEETEEMLEHVGEGL